MSGLLLVLLVVLVLANRAPHHCEKCCPGKSRRQLKREQRGGRSAFAHFWLKQR